MKKLTDRLAYLQKELTAQKLVNVAFPEFVKNTPVLTGNARRRTSKDAKSINADYPYAQRLDQGYSPKSPQGMVEPTIAAVRAYVNKIIGK
jgi:hypothetical protein